MNREFLKNLGIDDEKIEKIMAEHGKTVKDNKDTLETVTTERDNLQKQLKDRDKQLGDLADVDVNDLQKTIKALKEDNEEQSEQHKKELEKIKYNSLLDEYLIERGARSVRAAKGMLDTDKIHLSDDGEGLLGLEEQVKKLEESDGYLFERGKKSSGYSPSGGKSYGMPSDLSEAMTRPDFNMTEFLEANKKGE